MTALNRIILVFAVCFAVFSLSSCYEDEARIESNQKKKIEQARIVRLDELRSKLSSSFLLGALGYVCVGLLGPSATEGTRKFVADQFKMSKEDQISLATGIYWTVVGVIFLFSIFNRHLGPVRPAVWLLLGGTAYPFFVHVLPSLESGDKMRRKAAVGQMKSFFMLIFIFYIILRCLGPDGFGDIKLQ